MIGYEFDFETFTPEIIDECLGNCGYNSTYSSYVKGAILSVSFEKKDFIGNNDYSIDIDDIIYTLMFYTFSLKNSDEILEEDEDFKKRSKIYQRKTCNLEDFMAKTGIQKLVNSKKKIRSDLVSGRNMVHKKIDPTGVFQDNHDMKMIYGEDDPKEFVLKLHMLGNFDENDPRYYIHMVFRYYMRELNRRVLRSGLTMWCFGLQKYLDIMYPVNSISNLPPEFTSFVKDSMGRRFNIMSLPVPSKTVKGNVVYGYKFEDESWVPVMRQTIYSKFTRWLIDLDVVYQHLYPPFLQKGNFMNKNVVEILQKERVMRSIHDKSICIFDENSSSFFERCVILAPRVINVFENYNNRVFTTEGEQLRERIGFFLKEDIRSCFIDMNRGFNNFPDELLSHVHIGYENIDTIGEYCESKPIIVLPQDGELWRSFLLAILKVSSYFWAYGMKEEFQKFTKEYGTIDDFLTIEFGKLGKY